MAFFMDPGAMFLGCLNGVEQKFLIELIKTARMLRPAWPEAVPMQLQSFLESIKCLAWA